MANQTETLGSPYASPRAEWLVRNMLGCHHGLLWAEHCKGCEIVGLRQQYADAVRRAENARQRLMAMGEVVNDQHVRADVRATPKVAVATPDVAPIGYLHPYGRDGLIRAIADQSGQWSTPLCAQATGGHTIPVYLGEALAIVAGGAA